MPPRAARLTGTLVARWNLTVEFLDQATQTRVTPHTAVVDWQEPEVTLVPVAGAGTIPAFNERPGALPFDPNVPFRVRITYA